MRYHEIIQPPELLDEIEIVQGLGATSGHAQIFLGGTFITQESFGEIYHRPFPQHQQDVYYVGDKTSVFSYVVVEDRSGYHWLLEAFTQPQHRGANLSALLIQWLVKRLGKIIVDQQLTPISSYPGISNWSEPVI